MAVLSKPIPALYTVYVLRSTVRHASLYIGSTPNPPRRLNQHNGKAKGGAARTSRSSLRPWEMVALVSGFPSSVGALKFEWALTNPHLSLHIPSSSRIAVSSGHKRNGMPRRPRASLVSILSNLHLLLRVPSFSRWPLTLHFFAPDVHEAWRKWSAGTKESLREDLLIVTDFEAGALERAVSPDADPAALEMPVVGGGSEPEMHGIHALPLDYAPMKEYVAKGKAVFDFEKEGNCVVCREAMASGDGLYALCTNLGCEGVGHLSCWSRHLLPGEEKDSILPVRGTCPSCGGDVQWGDMMKELTLRVRGAKEVEKLLKVKRKRTVKS
ncbi:GIY-YIG catalytic domain-containing protein [Thozetella sp. PMI_491]|nr:GIY-YIG catalytic domain-containing protein [Thozetella sp. PMI_491]